MNYEYKGHKFKLKPFGLVYDKMRDIINLKIEVLTVSFTKDLDTSELDVFTSEIEDLQTNMIEIKELKRLGKASEEQIKILENIPIRIGEIQNKIQGDPMCFKTFNMVQKIRSQCYDIISKDGEFLETFFSEILEGDTSVINYSDYELAEFSANVMKDFFGVLLDGMKSLQSSKQDITD